MSQSDERGIIRFEILVLGLGPLLVRICEGHIAYAVHLLTGNFATLVFVNVVDVSAGWRRHGQLRVMHFEARWCYSLRS